MTEEIAKKHNSIIKWFCDNTGKGVWQQLSRFKRWGLTYEPSFDLGFTYVKNDEYVEYRKALADGKTVQYYVDGFVGWQDVTHFNYPCKGMENYRVKPDKPKFKIGDWVTINGSKPKQFKQFTRNLPQWNKSLAYENIELLDGMKFNIPNFDRSIVKPWKPQSGEWCWYGYEIVQVIGTIGTVKICRQQSDAYEEVSTSSLEPFIEALPTIIKDK